MGRIAATGTFVGATALTAGAAVGAGAVTVSAIGELQAHPLTTSRSAQLHSLGRMTLAAGALVGAWHARGARWAAIPLAVAGAILGVGTITSIVRGRDTLPVTPLAEVREQRVDGLAPRRYDYDVSIDATAGTMRGQGRIEVTNDSSGDLHDIVLRTWPNAPQLAAAGARAELSNVTVNGQPVPVEMLQDGTIARLVLDDPLERGARAEVRFDVDVSAGSQANRLGRTSDGIVSFGNALPTVAPHDASGWRVPRYVDSGESWMSLPADWNLTVHTDPTTRIVATGDHVRDTPTEHRFHAVQRRDALIVAGPAGRLVDHAAKAKDGTIVHVWTAPDQAATNEMLRSVTAAHSYYTERYGNAAQHDVSVIAHPQLQGMEYPDVVLARNTHEAIHELAHQWFYSLVGNDQYRDSWLDESVASWASADALRRGIPGARLTLMERLEGVAQRAAGAVSPLFGSISSDLGTHRDVMAPYVVRVYLQGAGVLDDLRNTIGDSAFRSGLRAYVDQHRGHIATPRDFIAAMSTAAGRDLSTWFAERGIRADEQPRNDRLHP